MAKYLDGEGLKLVVKDYDGKISKKVDAVSGKQLSTNDYDNTAKGIVDSVTENLGNKVDKVQGKQLSTNDYDADAKAIVDGVTGNLDKKVDKETGKQLIETTKVTKLDGIEDGAQVNEITEANLESKVTGKGFAKSSEIPTDYLTDDDLEGYAKSTDIPDVTGKQDKSSLGTDVAGLGFIKEDALSGLAKSTDIPDVSGKVDRTELNNYVTKAENESAMHYCGEVQSESDLTAKEGTAKQGDFYNVKDDDINRMWNGTSWDKMAPKIDISGKADRTDLPEALSTQEIQAIIAGE